MSKTAVPSAPEVSPKARLRQLIYDLERAILSENWPLVTQATTLLAPVLESVERQVLSVKNETVPLDTQRSALNASTGEIAEIRARLDACEQKLTEAMNRTGDELRRLRQGKRRLATMAVVPHRDAACQLDTHR